MTTLRIGTRKSALALWQAYYVRDQLQALHPSLNIELVEIVSQGDLTLDVPLSEVGGKGLFLKELEQALLEDRIDIAVHSMKDVTVEFPKGLHIPVVCPREDARDAFVSNRFASLADMPAGARVGTCSLRRRCQLLNAYPHLQVENLRGNVNTRLQRLDDGQYDAIILAVAGLKRLQMQPRIKQHLPIEQLLPAVGQGVVGVQCRVDDERVMSLIQFLNHHTTHVCVSAERAANAALQGGCHVPIAVYATLVDDVLSVQGLVGELDGSTILRAKATGSAAQSVALGEAVAADLLSQGADKILQKVYAN